MYLSEEAIDGTVRAVHDYSAKGSRLAFTYFDRAILERPTMRERLARGFVARVGEPFRFGWIPAELPAWLRERGFTLERDASMTELADELLPQRFKLRRESASRRIAVAQRM
jgi:O-methyltransferase involved in polyketide biosynthesis